MKKVSLFSLVFVTSMAVLAQNNPPMGSGTTHGQMRTPMEKKTRIGIDVVVNVVRYNEDAD